MKLVIITLTLLGLTCDIKSTEVEDVVREMLAILPKDKVHAIIHNYMTYDLEVKTTMEAMTGIKELVEFMKVYDLDLLPLLQETFSFFFYEAEDNVRNSVPNNDFQPTGEGLDGLFEDIASVMPLEKMGIVFASWAAISPEVEDLSSALLSNKFEKMVLNLQNQSEQIGKKVSHREL